MGDSLGSGKPSRYITRQRRQLGLAIPSCSAGFRNGRLFHRDVGPYWRIFCSASTSFYDLELHSSDEQLAYARKVSRSTKNSFQNVRPLNSWALFGTTD